MVAKSKPGALNTRRLDLRIERQKVGLFGDGRNEANDAADFAGR
jgi:hypothetical protein